MADPIDFWFDFTSPYSYLAAEKIDMLAAKYGRAVNWRPMLLGVAMQKTNSPLLLGVPLKGDYVLRDFSRSARFMGVPFTFPAKFPMASQNAARAFYWLQDHDSVKAREFALGVFRAMFVEGRDISDLGVLLDIAAVLGVDRDELSQAVGTQEIKDRLRHETEAAITAGVCGAPFIFVDNEPFWGADRLPQIEQWLATGGF
jgi:2-hydroxychromene-2-carboxylate isomerase